MLRCPVHDNTYNFQQWMSRLPQRWWTQRNAIRNANCKTSWIIKILNAHCALRHFLRAYLFECLYTPLIPVMYVMYVAGDGLWFWMLRKRPSLLECIWQGGYLFTRWSACLLWWDVLYVLIIGDCATDWSAGNEDPQTLLSKRRGCQRPCRLKGQEVCWDDLACALLCMLGLTGVFRAL